MAKATKTAKKKLCKNCLALPYLEPGTEPEPGKEYRPRVDRPAPYPGPRCFTHKNAKRSVDRARAHENRVTKIYGIAVGDYWKLYEFQGGVCYICRIATGATKKLAVDHNHETGEVRGLLCGPCNKGVIGHLRHNIDALQRAIEYLEDPPARRFAAQIAS
jgi:hypothetical protein